MDSPFSSSRSSRPPQRDSASWKFRLRCKRAVMANRTCGTPPGSCAITGCCCSHAEGGSGTHRMLTDGSVERMARFDREYFATAYNDYARQNPPWKLRFYRRLIERQLGTSTAPRVLEIGCGPGAFLASLDPGWTKFGSDVSRDAIEMA